MDKIIKKFYKDEYIYNLGYILYGNKVFPRIEIFKEEEILFSGYWDYGVYVAKGEYIKVFRFFIYNYSSCSCESFTTIKELFEGLKQHNEISHNIEKEFEELFILYKLNDFNEI